MNENIKDSNALGKEVGLIHKALCIISDSMGVDLTVATLKDYIKENERDLQSM